MNNELQNSFEKLVRKYFKQFSIYLNLAEPIFKTEKNVKTVIMRGTSASGYVALRYGPAEYHIEIFIYTNGKRWNLADLVKIESVQLWLKKNRSNVAGESRIVAEIISAFGLLSYGLKGVKGFEWLYS